MSVDVILYKVSKPTVREKNKIDGIHIDDLNLDNNESWEYKYFSQDDYDKNPTRFSDIMKYTQRVSMIRTITDYKRCFIDHGMPEDVNMYGYSYGEYDIKLSFADKVIYIPKDALLKYSHDETTVYYIYKYRYIDVDIPSWYAKTWIKELEKKYKIDLSYHPHELTKQFASIISDAIWKEYNTGSLCLDKYLAEFMVYLLQALTNPDKKLFIEFQD